MVQVEETEDGDEENKEEVGNPIKDNENEDEEEDIDKHSQMISHTFKNGDTMPMLGLGTWKSDPGDVGKAVKEAISIGYRLIDCAAVHGNEKEVGRAIAESIKGGTVARSDLFIISKLWVDSMAEEEVLPALKQTLADLQLDYLDLYMVHWPVAMKHGVVFPSCNEDTRSMRDCRIGKTWAQMEKGVDEGLTKHLGISNFSICKLHDIMQKARIAPEVLQVERHPYFQQINLKKYSEVYFQLHMMGFCPLGSGDRPDNMKTEDEPILLEDPVIRVIADKLGATPAQVLLKWQLETGTSTIVKSVQKEHLIENFESINFDLPLEDVRKIQMLDRDGLLRYIDGSFFFFGPYNKSKVWDEPPYKPTPGFS